MEDREPAKSFEELIVWQKAHALVLAIYKASRTFPKEELYGLSTQVRRSAVSVPANIAEGFKLPAVPSHVAAVQASPCLLSSYS